MTKRFDPAVTATRNRRFSRWIKRQKWTRYVCSLCSFEAMEPTERCPNPDCRAHMTRVSTV